MTEIEKKNESSRPSAGEQVDLEKVRQAWDVAVDVQRDLIKVIQASGEANDKTRRYSVAAMIVVFVLTALSAWFHKRAGESADRVEQVQAEVATDSESTLKAVRAVSEAVGAKIEADTAMHPIAEEVARQKAVEAQETVLAAEAAVATSPKDKAAAELKLAEIRRRQEVVEKRAPAAVGSGPGGEIDPEDDVAIEAAKGSGP